MKNVIRVIIIIAILLILVFLSVGIVRIVPRVLSSLASATVSIGSIFSGDNATTTPSGSDQGTTIVPNGNGFVIVGSTSTPSRSTSTPSIIDILKAKPTDSGKNYIPAPGSPVRNPNTGTVTRPSTGTASSQSCVNGRTSDLAISIISKGVINKTTGQFVETNTFTTGDTVSVRFRADNRGTCATGPWNLKVQMPSQNAADQVRDVTNIGALPAGSSVTGQANFDNPRIDNAVIALSATDLSGRDTDLGNNTASQALTVVNAGPGTNPGTVPVSGDGRADLAVRILQVGTLDAYNRFIPRGYGQGTYRVGERVAVQFEVINQGRTASGPWTFRADLGQGGQYQNQQYEASIATGAKTTYTIGYDATATGMNTITVYIDSLSQVNEYNESNNTASVGINVSY
ncbi:MAG TPA: CARDB domain-containing protein [Candidatus Paceibacterota bacterium]